MNIIYISYDGMTDSLGQSQVIPYLAGLCKNGHRITLLSCEKKNKFQEQRIPIKKLLTSKRIIWKPVIYSSLPSVLSKQKNVSLLRGEALKIAYNEKFDIVHCRSYMAALIGLTLQKKYGTKFIFDMRGFWADERIDGDIWSIKNRLHRNLFNYFKKKETEFLVKADYTISLTEKAKKEIHSWKQLKKSSPPIEVIPCCVDLDLFSKKNINKNKQAILQNELNISSDDFIITYLGSIGTWYMLDEMLDFFKCLKATKPTAKFLFITPDDPNEIHAQAIKKKIAKKDFIICSAQRNDVPTYISLSQLAIYFIKPLYSKQASSPTKTGEIMAMGIPIIANAGIGDSDEVIEKSNAGMLINGFSDKEYQRIVDKIDVLLDIDKANIRSTAEKYYSLDKGVEIYNNVYLKLQKNE